MSYRITGNTLISSNANQNDVTIPIWDGEAPVNYPDIRDSVALSMYAEGIGDETITAVLQTVDQALVNNERFLLWENDVPDELTPLSHGEYHPQLDPEQTTLEPDWNEQ